ncbi:hypothetical protein JO965_13145 [Microvirga sp. VF16]|nr:hypothetical protein JO965_13145 [Microvirga sp. VF16]
MGITERNFYRWKKQFAGMGVAKIRRLKMLEDKTPGLRSSWRIQRSGKWRRDSDETRPHMALGGLTLNAFLTNSLGPESYTDGGSHPGAGPHRPGWLCLF